MGVVNLIKDLRTVLGGQLRAHLGETITEELVETAAREAAHSAAPLVSNIVKELLRDVKSMNLGFEKTEATVCLPRGVLEGVRRFSRDGDVDALVNRLMKEVGQR